MEKFIKTSIKADLNQVISSWTAGAPVICFVNVREVEETFSRVLNNREIGRGQIEITVVKSDGYLEGKIKFINDDDTASKLVVGNLTANKPDKETTWKNENISVQQPLPMIKEDEVDDTMSVTLKADKSHVPDDMGTKEKVIEHPPVNTDGDFSMSSSSHLPHRQSPLLKHRCTTSIPTGMQGETMDHSYYSSSPDNVPMAPLSNLSHMQHVVRSQHHSTSISTAATGVCNSQIPSANMTHDGIGKEALAVSSSPEKYCNESVKKEQHTVYCVLHGIETSVGKYYETLEECKSFYNEAFANKFEEFLSREESASLTDFIHKDSSNYSYLNHIDHHLKSKKCPSFCSRLWKFCTMKNICSPFQYADEGLLIFSKFRKEKIGTICKDYIDLKKEFKVLGKGGFGRVYRYEQPDTGQQLAIKVEEKRSLTECDAKLFQKITCLQHPNVIEMLEYLTGPVKDNEKRQCLFVMRLMNRKDLNRQFKIHKCILDYMALNPTLQKFIFRNYLILFHQVFEGLRYLKTQHIVHRDIKPSNILVHQMCKCTNTILCTCTDTTETVLYVVGDLDLLCFEGASSGTKFEEWKMTQHDPAGTIEMKPLEAFYNSGKGELMIDHKSDIWSGSVTMMNVLVGKGAKWEPHEQIKKFLSILTHTIRTVSNGFSNCCRMLDVLVEKYKTSLKGKSESSEELKCMFADFEPLKKLLNESNNSLRKVQSFQGGVPEIFKEESPLAGILSTVYIANSLHWVCLSKLPGIHNTTLWNCMKTTLDCISEGVKFFPDNRQDAGTFVELLKSLKIQVME